MQVVQLQLQPQFMCASSSWARMQVREQAMIIARGRTSGALTCSNEVPGWTLSPRAMRHVVHGAPKWQPHGVEAQQLHAAHDVDHVQSHCRRALSMFATIRFSVNFYIEIHCSYMSIAWTVSLNSQWQD